MNSEVTVMNCVMIYDKENDTVLLQNRTKKWTGGCFPGGHLEDGETIVGSAEREVFEETGLRVTDLVACGFVHWDKGDRHELIFCYRTGKFSGELLQCSEGVNYWVKREKLTEEHLANWFRKQLPLFFVNRYTELSHINDGTGKFIVTFSGESPLPDMQSLPAFDTFNENR
ncbi:MAG: NUDIX domain-containing protein [Clostridia bacterium]|nr:NUDIX domain-containing protein [Clostridia bacterium]